MIIAFEEFKANRQTALLNNECPECGIPLVYCKDGGVDDVGYSTGEYWCGAACGWLLDMEENKEYLMQEYQKQISPPE